MTVTVNGNGSIDGVSPIAFSAHDQSLPQVMTTGVFSQRFFSATDFNHGGYFAASAWTPPAGRAVVLEGAVAMAMELNKRLSVAVYKNGAIFKRGSTSTATVAGQFTNAVVSCVDVPNGTDVYTFYVFHDNPENRSDSASPSTTYFQGARL